MKHCDDTSRGCADSGGYACHCYCDLCRAAQGDPDASRIIALESRAAELVVSSDGALPPDLVMAAEVTRLREALERISAILPCGEPCKPRVMCGTCHRGDDTDGEIDCTGCIARAALGRT